MKIDILTIFPEMFEGVFKTSIIGRAVGTQAVEIKVHNLRDWSDDNYKSVDDHPFGGGAGMVMKVDVVDRALTAEEHLIFIAPHFEGIDHRVHEQLADETYSIGPYVLSGGELPVMVVVDSLCRLLPGVLGNPESLKEESYSEDMAVEYPQYTRPAEYKGWKVPEVLLSGNHKEIEKWRKGK
ncbi:MAG: tRNA (guanine-N(1)-)-methyltransferase [Microgenomates group bacterium GW2011_GWC1_44_9]|nr:MAG: tRNA (guanine-N(1)-)-methyltransferase [Microgenomates group bacterium GW2011_GWC1_44_9]